MNHIIVNIVNILKSFYQVMSMQNRYGIDWFSQINFFQIYIIIILMHIGATGVGKSTQVPKLYAYGSKSIFLNLIQK